MERDKIACYFQIRLLFRTNKSDLITSNSIHSVFICNHSCEENSPGVGIRSVNVYTIHGSELKLSVLHSRLDLSPALMSKHKHSH